MSSTRAFDPVDGASLAFFRAAFGTLLLLEVLRYFAAGWIETYYLEPAFHFTYPGFGWVQPGSSKVLHALFAVLGVSSAGIAFGLAYRFSALVFTLGFTYTFLLEQARYLNHYYLVILLGALCVAVPAHRTWSLDARRHAFAPTVPAWSLGLMRTQIGLVYLFAGIAKLNADWLRAEPLHTWLPRHADLPLIGALLDTEACAWFFSYTAILLDLGAWPLLAWKRTRGSFFLAITAFHLLNATIFGIGMFPWVMISATTLFFSPDWPRRLLRLRPMDPVPTARPSARRQLFVRTALGVYVTLQLTLPLRHFLYPGNVHWTEEGHPFSWHMMLRTKQGRATFRVVEVGTEETWLVDPTGELESWQARKLAARPDMVHQYALHLAERARQEGRRVRVYATVETALNGRRPQLLVDPEVDLARAPRGLGPAPWIRPLRTRL